MAQPTTIERDSLPEGEETTSVSVREFCRLMGIHQETARIWLREGRVKGHKVPGGSAWDRWRIPRSELDRLKV
jgi:excisionase family DNA binding protein